MNRKNSMRTSAAALLLGLAVAGSAQAHYLWIEREGDNAKVYFGEWQENLRETQDGPFKAIQGAQIFDAAGKELTLERQPNHLLVAGAGQGDLRLHEEVMHRSAKVVYDIRSGRNETRAGSNFEIVPLERGGKRFTLMLDGKPLPKAELKLFGPPQWEKPYTTDAQGQFSIDTPWSGFYLIRAQYDDDSNGEFDGKKFDKIINVAILSFNHSGGLPWPAP